MTALLEFVVMMIYSSCVHRLTRGSCDHNIIVAIVLYPQQHITAHFSICRTISWCTDDPDYLFTGLCVCVCVCVCVYVRVCVCAYMRG